MKSIWKKEKKSICLTALLVAFMIGLDELLKCMIYIFDKEAIGTCGGSDNIFHYHPVFNESGSFLNLKFNLEYNYTIFLGITILGLCFGGYLFFYFLKIKQVHNSNYMIMMPTTFFLAGCLGRFLERIFWPFTLDYISIKEMGILDLIDIYLILGCAGLLMVACYIQWMENKLKKSVV